MSEDSRHALRTVNRKVNRKYIRITGRHFHWGDTEFLSRIGSSSKRQIVVCSTPLSYHLAMSDTSITTPPGFDDLPKAQQVRYLQALWDQISEHPDEIPVPESHLQLAEERLRRYRENPSSAQPAFEVIDRLSQDRK
jgi:hypothetical protein